MSKKVIILAGPNGAGKTTFARSFLPQEAGVLHFINADLIAAGLEPFQPEAAALRAGRIMVREIAMRAARGDSLYFLRLPNAETAIERVAARVQQGGHDIPEATVRRRFAAGLANFHRLYKVAVDDWAFFDNAGAAPVLIDWGDNG